MSAYIDAMVDLALEGPSGVAVAPGSWSRPFTYYMAPLTGAQTLAELRELRMEIHREDADRLGRLLVAENLRSIHARYPDTIGSDDNVPGPIDPYWNDYWYQGRSRRPSAVEGLKLLDCYEYQACESAEWHTSEARQFCEALRSRLIAHVPGYSEAPWEWTAEKARA
jgi:hypothetical protein